MDVESLLTAPATWVISIFNVVWFLYVTMHGDTRNPDTLVRFGATERYRIWSEGESWRLLTSCFLHIGWIHLLWNTYMMFGWCARVEQELGTVRFVMAYLMTGIGASAISVLGHRAIAAGASGAGFGMIGVTLMIQYRRLGTWGLFWSDPYVYSILRMTIIWVLIGIFLIRVDNYAHVGGLIFGIMAGYALTLDGDDPARIPILVGVIVIWFGIVFASLHPRFARRDGNDYF
ncbi:MAG TPA: rhomboid family intramembrane serine protease [Planctomycetota bacterium]|nr:rhomboid family intramembrane serine protease [Planctomycetota bacterium]